MNVLEARPVTLYSDSFWISPYVFSCFVALREKGVAFEVKDVKLQAAEQRAPGYRDGSWTGRVPALVHGDFWLTESMAILEYVEETFPAPQSARLLPEASPDRARARQLLSWLRSDETLPVRAERSAETIFYDLPRAPLSAAAVACTAKVVALAERFLRDGTGPLFGVWCIADAELAFFLRRLCRDEGALPPTLRAYAEARWTKPSIVEYASHARAPFIAY
jgi:glutathione S-transferase